MLVRPAAIAGLFYPANPDALLALVADLVGHDRPVRPTEAPKALIVPHAGLAYSGETAAYAYRQLAEFTDYYQRIYLLGPNHRVPLSTVAGSSAEAFRTPLGDYPLDTEQIERWLDDGWIVINDEAHRQEHCLEVQIPFLQLLGMEAPLVPLIVGQANAGKVARLAGHALDEERSLLLISTDLSHFHPYQEAQALDQITSDKILRCGADLTPEQACGCHALNGALMACAMRQLKVTLLDKRNSGDTAGDKDRVVGYGAYVIN